MNNTIKNQILFTQQCAKTLYEQLGSLLASLEQDARDDFSIDEGLVRAIRDECATIGEVKITQEKFSSLQMDRSKQDKELA